MKGRVLNSEESDEGSDVFSRLSEAKKSHENGSAGRAPERNEESNNN